MIPERLEATKNLLSFEVWKLRLRTDCAEQDKLAAFDAFTDGVLRVLWERGFDPTVKAICGGKPDKK